jgi:hypothetical protein
VNFRPCLLSSDGVDVDEAVGGAREERVSIGRPGEGHNPRDTRLAGVLGSQLIKNVLVLQVPDEDGSISGGAQPVVLGGEAHGIDSRGGIQGIQMLTVVHIPEHSGSVLTTRSAQGAVRRDGDRVEDTRVTRKVGLQLAVVQVPNLDELVPTTRNDQRILSRGRKTHAGNPVGVVILRNGVLALSKGVPKLDSLVTRTRDNLTVVGGESDGVHILGVSLKLANRETGVQVPETHSGVHGTGEGELTVGRDHGVAHRLVVTTEAATSITGGVSVLRGQLPDKGSLVTRTRHNEVGLLVGGGDGGDPARVTLEGTFVDDVSHCEKVSRRERLVPKDLYPGRSLTLRL